MKTLWISLVAVQTLTTALSQVTLFSGSDPGAVQSGPWPNSANAAAAFNTAAGLLGLVSTINFEALPLGQFASLTLAPGVTATQGSYDPTVGGIVTVGYASPAGAPTGFNTTPGGSKFLGFVPGINIGSATLDFGFSPPIQAWGAYFVGLESTVPGTLSVQFNDGSANSYPLLKLDPAGVEYFAFTDPKRSISHVTLTEGDILRGPQDIYGVDDVSFVVVPEPRMMSLFCFGMGALLLPRFRSGPLVPCLRRATVPPPNRLRQ